MKECPRFVEAASNRKTTVLYVKSGDKICLGETEMEFVHPDNEFTYQKSNEYSLTSVLKFMDFSAIFTGDLEGTGEEAVKKSGCLQTCDVLKVAHHGSKNSTDDEFLQLIQPKISVISCGAKNTYGHPHQETLERLRQAKSDVYCTADHGAVTIYTDGKKIEVKTINPTNK